jgi:alkylation response protein AidB-like acyl-CoA dehydrogenase
MTATLERADLMARAAAFGEFADRFSDQADRDRRLPDVVIEEFMRTGLLRMIRSERLGGYEVSPTTYCEVLREIATHSAAAAWVAQVLTMHEWFMSYTDPRLQADVWGDNPDAVVVDAFAPSTNVTEVDGGYLLTGQWKFVSGVMWSDWAALGAIAVVPGGDGTPEPCLMFVPRSAFTIIDDWDPIGLRGTASNSVVGEDMFVPTYRAFPVARVAGTGEPCAERLDDGLLYHVPWSPMLSASIFPASIGIAQRALADFQAWTEKRLRPFEAGAEQRQNPSAQIVLAECSCQIDAAHALALRMTGEIEQYAREGRGVLTPLERARLFAWRGHISRTCAEVVDKLYREAGAHALFPSHPLHRSFRDVHAATAHASLSSADAMMSYGRTLFGGAGHPMF